MDKVISPCMLRLSGTVFLELMYAVVSASVTSTSLMQENGCTLLYCERQGTSWSSSPQKNSNLPSSLNSSSVSKRIFFFFLCQQDLDDKTLT